MVAGLVRFAVRRSLRDTRYVHVVPRRRASGLVGDVYRQVERDFGMLAPPVAMHAAEPAALAASWMILRETLLAAGSADRASKEAVATGVSDSNSCPYCVDVHGMTLDAISADAGEHGRPALVEWARATGTAESARRPPFPPEHAPDLMGVAVAFHYYNRVVNVFLRDSPFPAHVPESAKPRARKVLGGVLRPTSRLGPQPGESLDLLPSAQLPDECFWARPNPVVAEAFARAWAAIERVGADSVPDRVRALVHDRLAEWDGTSPGLSRSWVEEAASAVPVAERPAARLALVIAMASYQVDDGLVDEFRRAHAGDATLVGLAAWASMAATRRICTWIVPAPAA